MLLKLSHSLIVAVMMVAIIFITAKLIPILQNKHAGYTAIPLIEEAGKLYGSNLIGVNPILTATVFGTIEAVFYIKKGYLDNVKPFNNFIIIRLFIILLHIFYTFLAWRVSFWTGVLAHASWNAICIYS